MNFGVNLHTVKNKPKKPAPAEKRPVQAKATEHHSHALSPELILSGILFLFLITANNWSFKFDLSLLFALGAVVILIVALFHKENRKHIFGDMSPIFLLLLAHCLLYSPGCVRAPIPNSRSMRFSSTRRAGRPSSCCTPDSSGTGRICGKIILFFSACVALASLLSIELATSRYLFGPLQGIAGLIGAQVPGDFANFENNTRMTSVIGNPNVFAQIAVLGMFAALWNAGKPGSRSRRNIFSMALAIVCGTAFVLCFSLGTILSYGAALVLALIFSTG
jgi:lysylphosphatidylglycerol synthetase-like protein (DUF2156 family)